MATTLPLGTRQRKRCMDLNQWMRIEDAWLDYLKKPESKIMSDEKKPVRTPRKQIEPDLIPPAALPEMERRQ
jgi:hypothetical protein